MNSKELQSYLRTTGDSGFIQAADYIEELEKAMVLLESDIEILNAKVTLLQKELVAEHDKMAKYRNLVDNSRLTDI